MSKIEHPQRILLKLSGELLQGIKGFGIDLEACEKLADNLKKIHEMGIELGIVLGGGNIFRAISLTAGMPRTPADHMGMLSTLLNGIALQEALILKGLKVCLMTGLDCPRVAESFNCAKAVEYLKSGTIVIFVGGTGNPYFTTDTAAALRASEIQADLLLKATKVDGVYDSDPVKNSDAVKFDKISHSQVLLKELKVMDASAIALCRSNHIPVYVFNMHLLDKSDLRTILFDFKHGTLITE